MSGSGPEPLPSPSLAELLSGLSPRCREDRDGGAAVLLVALAHSRRIPWTKALMTEAAAVLGVGTDHLEELVAFWSRVMSSGGGAPRPLVLCRGLTCTLRGAGRLHAELRSIKGSEGPACQEVFCLSHCDQGPSVRFEDDVYVVRAKGVVRDGRSWRKGDTGPVPIQDTR